MSRPARRSTSLKVYEHDLPEYIADKLITLGWIAVDTETGGLLYREHGLYLVQIADKDRNVWMVRRPNHKSKNLIRVLTFSTLAKVFHNAYFDVGFIRAHMGIMVKTFDCTKVMMKIVNPDKRSGLAASLREVLGIIINKEGHGNWDADELSQAQLEYASEDVLDLLALEQALNFRLRLNGMTIYSIAMQTIRNKIVLETEGFTDLLDYEQNDTDVTLHQRTWWQSREDDMSPGDNR